MSWIPVALLKDVKKHPKEFVYESERIILYKNKNDIIAMENKCPHRNYPLSEGNIINNKLVCSYHGWNFNKKGELIEIPNKIEKTKKCKMIKTYITLIHNDVVFISNDDGENNIDLLDKGFFYKKRFNGAIEDILENFLDPMHTSYVHKNIVRSVNKKKEVTVVISEIENGVEARYKEEKQSGIINNIFGSGVTESVGRIIKPKNFELEYNTKSETKLLIKCFINKIEENKYDLYFQLIFSKDKIPNVLKIFLMKPFLLIALKQDYEVLNKQQINKLGKTEDYKSTELDIMYPHICAIIKNKKITIKNKELSFKI
jgi:phenylpropionate dioxygenase-like ring-hydroxylating dioxygenase large terminal subunit